MTMTQRSFYLLSVIAKFSTSCVEILFLRIITPLLNRLFLLILVITEIILIITKNIRNNKHHITLEGQIKNGCIVLKDPCFIGSTGSGSGIGCTIIFLYVDPRDKVSHILEAHLPNKNIHKNQPSI